MRQPMPTIYQLKIVLNEVHPQVWRRVQVPSDIRLDHLHQVLQTALGWTDAHQHAFSYGQQQYTRPDEEVDLEELDMHDERRVLLSDVLSEPGQTLGYEYDFGDYWQHTIKLEKVLAPALHRQYPVCLGGKRSSPPEDCGGAQQYARLVSILKNPDHLYYEEMKEWAGRDFDPEGWNRQKVHEELAVMGRSPGWLL